MICHKYKCIFVHIPKNAGQSVETFFLKLNGLTWETRSPLLLRKKKSEELGPPRLAHLKGNEYLSYKYVSRSTFEEYLKFAIVRNPYSRLVSIYQYLGFSNKIEFKYFVKGIFSDYIFDELKWFVGPQCDYIYDDNNKLLMDYVIYFEDIQHGFQNILNLLNIPPAKLPHVNKSNLKKKVSLIDESVLKMYGVNNDTDETFDQGKNWKEYYDYSTIKIVEDLYQDDISNLGYEYHI